MAEIRIEIPDEFEEEVESWGIELELGSLFLVFLKQELEKIRKFYGLIKSAKNEFELKRIVDEIDDQVLEILADKILSKSQLTNENIGELSQKLKERVAKRHSL